MISGHSGPDPGKNDYYRDASGTMMRIVNIEAVIILGLTFALAFFLGTRQNQDRYIAETGDGKGMQMVALSLPNMGRLALSDWVAEAVSQIMTFGFNDLDARFVESRKDFTEEGWGAFRRGMVASKIIDDMMEAQQIVTSVPASPPILKQEGLINGRYSWVFDVPLLVTFRAGGIKVSRPRIVHMVVKRIPTEESPDGVGISEWDIY